MEDRLEISQKVWLLVGFIQFCEEHQFDFEILDELYSELEFESKEVYITIEHGDLVNLIQQIKEKNLVMGKDVGLMSYNETPLKVLLGITVISTNFKRVGGSSCRTDHKKQKRNLEKSI